MRLELRHPAVKQSDVPPAQHGDERKDYAEQRNQPPRRQHKLIQQPCLIGRIHAVAFTDEQREQSLLMRVGEQQHKLDRLGLLVDGLLGDTRRYAVGLELGGVVVVYLFELVDAKLREIRAGGIAAVQAVFQLEHISPLALVRSGQFRGGGYSEIAEVFVADAYIVAAAVIVKAVLARLAYGEHLAVIVVIVCVSVVGREQVEQRIDKIVHCVCKVVGVRIVT